MNVISTFEWTLT